MAQNAQAGEVIYPANVPGLKKAWAYTTEGAIESMKGNHHEQHD